MKVGIINYGVGNHASILRACSDLNLNFTLLTRPSEAMAYDMFILPGVGSFNYCIDKLNLSGWSEVIKEEVLKKEKYILGICIGMHLLSEIGFEGSVNMEGKKGLNLLPGKVLSLKKIGCKLSVPHVGWNSLIFQNDNLLLKDIPLNIDFYFSHSYSFKCSDIKKIIATTNHGINFHSVLGQDNIWGVQFHPEKSSRVGLKLLQNYVNIG